MVKKFLLSWQLNLKDQKPFHRVRKFNSLTTWWILSIPTYFLPIVPIFATKWSSNSRNQVQFPFSILWSSSSTYWQMTEKSLGKEKMFGLEFFWCRKKVELGLDSPRLGLLPVPLNFFGRPMVVDENDFGLEPNSFLADWGRKFEIFHSVLSKAPSSSS